MENKLIAYKKKLNQLKVYYKKYDTRKWNTHLLPQHASGCRGKRTVYIKHIHTAHQL